MKSALFLILAAVSILSAQWRQINVTPVQFTGVPQTAVFVNSQLGYIAGENGSLFRTTDGGFNWTKSLTLATTTIKGIIAFSDSIVITAGFGGTLYRSLNAGRTWTSIPSGTTANLMAAYKVSSTTGFIVGLTGVILKTSDAGASWSLSTVSGSRDLWGVSFFDERYGFVGSRDGYFYKTTNGGATWNGLNTFPAQTNLIFNFSFKDTSTIYAVGSKLITAAAGPQIWKSTNSGTTWTSVSSFTGNGELYSIHWWNDLTAVVTGSQGHFYKTENGGTTWQTINNPIGGTVTKHQINGSAYFLGGKAIVAGYYNDAPNSLFYTLTTQDLGTTWKTQYSLTSTFLNDVHFVNSAKGYLCGDNGSVWYTYNGGNRWYKGNTGSSAQLTSIHAVDTAIAYCSGPSGLLLKTTNGGVTWVAQTTGTTRDLRSVQFLTPLLGYFSGDGGTIRKTIDGGTTWTAQTSPYPAAGYGLHFATQDIGYVVGSGGMIIRTTDGGSTWLRVIAPTQYRFYSVHAFSASQFIAVSDSGKVFYSADSGNTLQMTTLGKMTLRSISFSNRSTGFIAADSGKYFSTTDGGLSWVPGASLNHTSNFFSINTVAGSSQWFMCGANGVLYSTDNNAGITSIHEGIIPTAAPVNFSLQPNFPNPFNPATTLSFSLKVRAFAQLTVYSITGSEIATVYSGDTEPGNYQFSFSPATNLAGGVYFYRLSVSEPTGVKLEYATGKMIFLK